MYGAKYHNETYTLQCYDHFHIRRGTYAKKVIDEIMGASSTTEEIGNIVSIYVSLDDGEDGVEDVEGEDDEEEDEGEDEVEGEEGGAEVGDEEAGDDAEVEDGEDEGDDVEVEDELEDEAEAVWDEVIEEE